MVFAVLILVLVGAIIYYFKKHNPNITVEQEAKDLVTKAEADGTKFEAFSEAELKQIEVDVNKDVAEVKVKL